MTDIVERIREWDFESDSDDEFDMLAKDAYAAAEEIERLRSLLSKHAECETMINQELKDVRAKLAVFQEG